MRRMLVVLSILAVALLGVTLAGPRAVAQDDNTTPESELSVADHPIVGAWIITVDGTDPSITTFTADGLVHDTGIDLNSAGVWEATGDNTADATFVGFLSFEGFEGYVWFQVSATVSEDGNTLEAPFTYTAVGSDGTVFESDSGVATGVRLEVQSDAEAGQPLAGMPTWVVAADDGGEGDDSGGAGDATAEPTVPADDEEGDGEDATPVP